MPIQTIVEPSADEQKTEVYNTRMRRSNVEKLEPSRKYAIILLALKPAVIQPDSYTAIGAAIKSVPGIDNITLLIDGQAPETVPVGKQLRMVVDAHLRIDNAPEA